MKQLLGSLLIGTCLGTASLNVAALETHFSLLGFEPLPSVDHLFWDQMTAQQRAALWPLLSHQQRLFQWRYMTKQERREMRQNMTVKERKDIKYRYIIAVDQLESQPARLKRELTDEERQQLRRQVRQVHVEIRRGIPYNCTDPTDCPKNASRIREAQAGSLLDMPTP
ncbi:MAG: hypothetical protein J6S08_04660 [Duodenibacillus sp.]|nr:hypothetical protein [Duodenibacillus sp.]